MKKILLILLLFVGFSFAQESFVPSFVSTQVKVHNLSKGNLDAETIQNKVGDVLRYSIQVSANEPVKNFVVTLDLSSVLAVSDIVDHGLGKIDGTVLRFPTISRETAFEETLFFTARLTSNCNENNLVFVYHDDISKIPLSCEVENIEKPILNQSGTSWLLTLFLSIFLLTSLVLLFRR